MLEKQSVEIPQQWKMIYLVRRNPALTASEFPQAWREHSALGKSCHNVRDKVKSVTQCSRVLENNHIIEGVSSDYDGVNLLLMSDKSATEDIWSDEETLRIMRPDEPRVFANYIKDCTVVCTEELIKDDGPTDYCLQYFLKIATGSESDTIQQVLSELLLNKQEALFYHATKIVLNTVHGKTPPGYNYAFVIECWFNTESEIASAIGSQSIWNALGAELSSQFSIDTSVCMLTRVTHRRP